MPSSSKVTVGLAMAALAGTASVHAKFASIPMNHATRGTGPFYYGTHATKLLNHNNANAAPGNGSDVPTGGNVWPTAIYWTMVEVGTPPLLFPVAIDSGSGDLDIGGEGCVGCVTTEPNRPYDHTQSSTSKGVFPFHFSNSYQTCDLKDPTVRVVHTMCTH